MNQIYKNMQKKIVMQKRLKHAHPFAKVQSKNKILSLFGFFLFFRILMIKSPLHPFFIFFNVKG